MRAPILAIVFTLSSCCSFGIEVSVRQHVEETGGSLLVVYYPEHATWNTGLMNATIEVDGEPVGRLCEGDFLALRVAPGTHVLTTSRDVEGGCSGAFLRPAGGWPAVEIIVGDGPVYLRFGADDYVGPSSQASICYRRLTAVDEATAHAEAGRLDLIEP